MRSFSYFLQGLCSLLSSLPPLRVTLISTIDVCLRLSERRWKIRSSWSTTCWTRWTRWSSAVVWPSPSSRCWTTWRWDQQDILTPEHQHTSSLLESCSFKTWWTLKAFTALHRWCIVCTNLFGRDGVKKVLQWPRSDSINILGLQRFKSFLQQQSHGWEDKRLFKGSVHWKNWTTVWWKSTRTLQQLPRLTKEYKLLVYELMFAKMAEILEPKLCLA